MKTDRIKIFLLLLGMVFLANLAAFSQIEMSQAKVEELREILIERMDSGEFEVPPIVFSKTLIANGKFENDTIWMGIQQKDFHTDDDIISIIYHEYSHFIYSKVAPLPVQKDSSGKIVQWVTDEMYDYFPDSIEVHMGLKDYLEELDETQKDLTDSQRVFLLNQMRTALFQPQRLHFQYAPSNLAYEELLAYTAQLAGQMEQFYDLSDEAKAAIVRRINQLQDTYQRRLDYEKRHVLGPDGGPYKRGQKSD